MKKTHLFAFSILSILYSCSKVETNTETNLKTSLASIDSLKTSRFMLDSTSKVNWKGRKVFENEGHYGRIGIKDGFLLKNNLGKLVGGKLVVDMHKIVCLDEPNLKLVAHLKNNDFFMVNKYPTATFEIISVNDKELIGDLTIKDKTLSHTVAYSWIENRVIGNLTFNRQKFGVAYNSPAGLALENLDKKVKERLIQDEIEIEFNLKAKE
jgi:YceI-like domain